MIRLSLAAGLSALALVACAGDPAVEVRDARDAELEAAREHDEDVADQDGARREDYAEVNADATDARAAEEAPATQERMEAEASFQKERDVYRSEARVRLEKLDARTEELRVLVMRAGTKATSQSKETLSMIEVQRGQVTQALEQLPRVPGSEWEAATEKLNARLDDLDAFVDKAALQVDQFS